MAENNDVDFKKQTLGRYYLRQFYITHLAFERKKNFEQYKKEFSFVKNALKSKEKYKLSNVVYKYKKIIQSKPFLILKSKSLDDWLHEQEKAFIKKQSNQNLSKIEKQQFESISTLVRRDTKELYFEKKFEVLPLNIEAPLIYYAKEISKTKTYVKEPNFQLKIIAMLYKYPYEKLLEKIKLIFGNTSLRSILLGLAFISQVEDIPSQMRIEMMRPLPPYEEWVKYHRPEE